MTLRWREAPEAEFAVIGKPVGHSLSPQMQMGAFKALGLPFRYVAIEVEPGEVGEALEHLRDQGYRGINVTVPHKAEALAWAGSADELTRRIGAANTLNLSKRSCTNTDAPGFLETLHGYRFQEKEALVLGAGGSARALVAALIEAGWRVRIHNRTAERANEMAGEVGGQVAAEPDPTGAYLIVNTTSAGLHGGTPDLTWDNARPDALAYDLVYGREPTPFLRKAESRGLQTSDGLELLVAQGALSLEWWLDTKAPRWAMREALSC